MKIVEIYGFELNEYPVTRRVICTVKLVGKSCRFEGSKFIAKELKANGIYTHVGKRGKFLFPHDGLKFMKQLSTHYSGSIIRASDVLIVPD
jgi:hypothetical protein|tara:strand:+ start:2427 stop:2699 length:273 start_codon:yes stop_codon:yes gene_type:complete